MTEIFCALDYVLLLADHNDPEKHKHLLISLKGNFDCLIEGEKISCEGIMILLKAMVYMV